MYGSPVFEVVAVIIGIITVAGVYVFGHVANGTLERMRMNKKVEVQRQISGVMETSFTK